MPIDETRDKPEEAALIQRARELLAQQTGITRGKLRVDDHVVHDDQWIYLLIEPDDPDVRSLDYLDSINRLETQLRHELYRPLLIVKTRPEPSHL